MLLQILGLPASLRHVRNMLRASKIRVAYTHKEVLDEIGPDAALAYLQVIDHHGTQHKYAK